MKRILLSMAILFGSLTMQAQLKIGLDGGIPTGDLSDIYSFTFGADVYYYFLGADDELLNIGATAGYQHFVGAEILNTGENFDAGMFLPLAGAARLNLLKIVEAGADIGYALGLNDGNDGGFYWRAVAGLDFGKLELNAYFLNVANDGFNTGSLGASIIFDLEGN
jgi:hypothetical protein